MAVLPPGPYILTAVSVGDRKVTQGGWQAYSIQWQLHGTDWKDCWSWITNSPNAKWLWEDMVENFRAIPSIIGRSFLFDVRIEKPHGKDYRHRNRVGAPLAEMVEP